MTKRELREQLARLRVRLLEFQRLWAEAGKPSDASYHFVLALTNYRRAKHPGRIPTQRHHLEVSVMHLEDAHRTLRYPTGKKKLAERVRRG